MSFLSYSSQSFYLSLVSTHLNKQSSLPDFIGLLWNERSFTSQFSSRYYLGQLVAFKGRQNLSLVSLFGWYYCLCSWGVEGYSCLAPWLGVPIGWVKAGFHVELSGWKRMLAVFQGQLGPLVSLCNHIWFGGASIYAPQTSRWCHWLDSTFKWGHRPVFTVGRASDYALRSNGGMQAVPVVKQSNKLGFAIR